MDYDLCSLIASQTFLYRISSPLSISHYLLCPTLTTLISSSSGKLTTTILLRILRYHSSVRRSSTTNDYETGPNIVALSRMMICDIEGVRLSGTEVFRMQKSNMKIDFWRDSRNTPRSIVHWYPQLAENLQVSSMPSFS